MKTMKTFNDKLRLEFKVLLKSGKEGVWKFIEGAEELFTAIEHPNEFDLYVSQILAEVRKNKRFDFFSGFSKILAIDVLNECFLVIKH